MKRGGRMNSLDNVLQERLARLEAGEPLEACVAGLPEDEAILVRRAARLRATQASGLASDKAAAQRRELLKLAKEKSKMDSQSAQRPSRPRWLLPAIGLSSVAALILVCALVASAASGLFWLWQKSRGPQVAQNATPAPNATPAFGMGVLSTSPIALEAPDPQSAVLGASRGTVEVQSQDGTWTAARDGQTIKAGQRIRTGALSTVTLGFYDGSQTRLGPHSEVSIDTLDAQKSGPRVIVLTQWLGESKHDVAKSSDPGSRYEVHTPSGVGTAKGTSFHVLVTTALLVRFDVDEGAVAVTSLNTTVVVVAGQSTIIVAGQAPTQPVFRIVGEGKVEQTGSVWKIAGRTFRTDEETVITGNPEVGDLVAFEARIVTDGSPVLDRVVLLARAPENRFSFTGRVDAIGDTEWTIAGRTVNVDELTNIDEDIQVGDIVEVKGGIAQDGTLWATRIHLLEEDEEGLPFEFVGVVDEIADTQWSISGIEVTVDNSTQIETGLAMGDVVRVRGRIRNDGTWLAKSIEQAEEDEREFAITGRVESRDPWMVSGIAFETDARTEIDEGVEVGDRVKVEGRILDDGRWVADEIELLEDEESQRFQFTGLVSSTDPWNVGGIDLAVDDKTDIEGDVAVGDLVRVKGVILPDGTWLAQKIERLDRNRGCLSFSTAVRSVEADQIVLLDWQA